MNMNSVDPPIYLDGFATMPLAPEAQEAMVAAWTTPANAGSPHILGERAAAAISGARADVAKLIASAPSEIVFTSSATEANNLAMLGVADWAVETQNPRRRIVVSAVEHKAVLEPAHRLKKLGFDVVVAPVDYSGVIDLSALRVLVDSNTLLISIMVANNETGVLQPLSDVVAIARANGALIHCDGAQAAGKIPLDVVELDIDYLSLSSHKMYGPVGVGGLYVSAAAPPPRPIQFGGGQQNSIRPGTEPVPLIVGFGAAASLACSKLSADAKHGDELALRLLAKLQERQAPCRRTTNGAPVLPGTLSLSALGVDADDLVSLLQTKVCFSTGSACTSGQFLSSHVLLAMGMTQMEARTVFRIYCNRYTTENDIDIAADEIAKALLRARLASGRSRQ
ncbi:cysteine desulfurase [Mesorhizobium australicum]|uniref:cysteine desulfurase family protein n=1 Tax=Mesorhizobium australicum TaxID=536018 RepID=UPI00333A1034